jgi:hypothetical protein
MPFKVIYKFLEFINRKSVSNNNDDFNEMCFISNKIKNCADNLRINNCLTISSLIFFRLRKEGFVLSFNIGVKKKGNKLESHCWVSNNQRPLLLEDGLDELSLITYI